MPTLDLYGSKTPLVGGSISADASMMHFAGIGIGDGPSGPVGMITQQMNIGYQRQVMRIFEMGSVYQYFSIGRSQGGLNLSRILGPRPLLFTFYAYYGDGCNVMRNQITFTFKQACRVDSNFLSNLQFLTMVGCVLTSVGFSGQAEQAVLGETSQMLFVSMIPYGPPESGGNYSVP